MGLSILAGTLAGFGLALCLTLLKVVDGSGLKSKSADELFIGWNECF